MLTFHPAASSLAISTIQYRQSRCLTLHLHQLFSSRNEPMFVMASHFTLFGDSTVNTKSTQRSYTREFKLSVVAHYRDNMHTGVQTCKCDIHWPHSQINTEPFSSHGICPAFRFLLHGKSLAVMYMHLGVWLGYTVTKVCASPRTWFGLPDCFSLWQGGVWGWD